MTHHESGMSEEQKKKTSEMVQKQRAFEEGRGHDVSRSTMTTGQGGPEAEERSKEMGVGEHTMQTEAPTTAKASKEGFAMAGSKGTETVKRSKEENR